MTILHTADLHGRVATDRPEGGGLLRCAAAIRSARSRDARVLLVDVGDLFQGSAESFLSEGRVVAECVRALGYDALVPGNHEFDAGFDYLRRFYDQAGTPVLSADLRNADGGPALPGQAAFLFRDLDGVRVAIVGLSNPLIPLWSRPCLLDGVRVDPSLEALRRVLPEVRAGNPDILVLAVHQGWRAGGDDAANNIRGLAAAFPDFDLILGAHSHQAVAWKTVAGVAYSQAGSYGQCLGVARLVFDTETRRLVSKHLSLQDLPADAPADDELARLAAPSLAAARRHLGVRIGAAAADLKASSRWPGQSAVQNLIARAIAERAGAQVVFHRALTRETLAAGPIYRHDLWRIVPYENFIGVARLTTNELAEILDENAGFYRTREFRGVSGLTYNLDPDAPPGARVSALCLADPPSDGEPDVRIRVAFNSYDMASAGGRLPRLRAILDRPGSDLEEMTDTDTREAVEAYIRRHAPLEVRAEPGARVARKTQAKQAATPRGPR